MKKVLKGLGILTGALAAGAILGNLFGRAGYSTPGAVAVIMALCAACHASRKRKMELMEE